MKSALLLAFGICGLTCLASSPPMGIIAPPAHSTVKCSFNVLGTSTGQPSLTITFPVNSTGSYIIGAQGWDFASGHYFFEVELCDTGAGEDIEINIYDAITQTTTSTHVITRNCPACGQPGGKVKHTEEPPVAR